MKTGSAARWESAGVKQEEVLSEPWATLPVRAER